MKIARPFGGALDAVTVLLVFIFRVGKNAADAVS
jgi:hypothetical protein